MPVNLVNSAVATGLEKDCILIPKKGNAKEYLNYCTTALISHASKVMLKSFKLGSAVSEPRTFRCTNWV